jgi:single-strand DNA-binding protein
MINQGQILGRVGKIDNKTTQSGMKISNVSIVTSKKYTKNGEKQEKVTWHNVTLFNKLSEIAEKFVAIGDLLYVQGEMDTQKYTDAQGQEKTKSFIIGHDIKLMPRSKEHKPPPKDNYGTGIEDELIPF